MHQKKKQDFWNAFLKVQQVFSDEIKFINIFSKHLEKLLFVKNKILLGFSSTDSMKALRPPIFFKQEELFLSQLDLWSYKELAKTIKKLHFCQMSILKNETSCKITFLFLFLLFVIEFCMIFIMSYTSFDSVLERLRGN